MTDLADSYCERCGAHYTFDAEPPKPLSLKSARVLARGLRNFVMNDSQSFADSMLIARNEDERLDASRMTKAFHKAFNFCMTCRQYACEDCWNVKQGACLTCAPEPEAVPVARESHLIVRLPAAHLGTDLPMQPTPTAAAAQFAGPAPVGGPDSSAAPAMFSAAPASSEWPSVDLAETAPSGDVDVEPRPERKTPVWLARRGSRDGETAEDRVPDPWRLWPITDPLAPEMTLTRDELELVHANLGRPADTAAIEPAPAAEPLPVAADELEPACAAAAEAPAGPEAEPNVEHGAEERPMPARLFSHFGRVAQIVRPAATPARSAAQVRGHVPDELWPHATPWLERPITATSLLQTAADATPAAPNAAQAEPIPGATSVQAATQSPAAEPARHERAFALEPVAGMAIRRPPSFQPEGMTPAARDETPNRQQPLLDSPEPATAPVYIEQPAAPWPPLGAMWPAVEPTSQVWAAPAGVAPSPAVLASASSASSAASAASASAAASTTIEIWAQSSAEVMNRGTVRVCHHCSLPVSTHARFCRRCGNPQV